MLPNHSQDDALESAGNVHSLLFENDRFRVLKINFPPGAVAPKHWHPDNVLYILEPATLRVTTPESEPTTVELRAGGVKPMQSGYHEVENIGATTMQAVMVELKS